MRLQERALAKRWAEETDDEERARLERRLQVLHQQRKKGIDLAKEMSKHDH
ncbi:hypothetical protein [Thiococcus pfennigii]|jgi:hypothetical protein|uniref:hypothetical protein n=1 Tax=Thiococcus pfennigii TaxID=1057 RepID=UPI0019071BFF|nr:hypothetical protein [Thiococcus pfennigii]